MVHGAWADNHVTHDTRVIGALESERYADMIGINTYKEAIALSNKNDDKINANYKEKVCKTF